MRRAQKGLKFTQVVVVNVALIMQSNCSCPFKEKNLSNVKKRDIPNMLLLFIKLMVISTLMIHLFIIIDVIYFKICNVLFALNIIQASFIGPKLAKKSLIPPILDKSIKINEISLRPMEIKVS